MKKTIKFFSILFIALIAITSCSKDDDPANNDLFAGTYKGRITYVKGTTNKSTNDGSVFVTKVGSKYNFRFSDDIPNINGVEFKNDGDDTVITIGGDETKYIKITASQLTIAYTDGDAVWTANCQR